MAERVHEIRAAVERRAARRIRRKRSWREEQPFPYPDEEAPAERKPQIMRRVRARARRQAAQVSPQVLQIGVGDLGERRIRERRKIVRSIRPQAAAHGLHEILFAPAPDAGVLVGRDVGPVEGSKRRLQRAPARERDRALRGLGMAAEAAAGFRQIFAALRVALREGALEKREKKEREKQKPRRGGACAGWQGSTASRGTFRGSRRRTCRSRRSALSPRPGRRSC